MNPELRPLFCTRKAGRPLIFGSTSTAVRRSEILPIFCQGECERVRRERHGLGVKVAAGEYVAIVEQQRVVGDGVGLDAERRGALAQQIETRAHHLRLAAEGVGILHARAIPMRGADFAAASQGAEFARDRDLSGLAADLVNALVEGRIAAHQRIDRQGARDDRGGEHVLGAEQACQGERGRYLRSVDERETLLGAERVRRESRPGETFGRRHHFAADAHLADTQQHRTHMGERREIPGSA